LEELRPAVRERYARNLVLSRRRDFSRRVLEFLARHQVRLVRIHTGGDYYSVVYSRKWLKIMCRASSVRFFLYSRSWRVPAILAVLAEMALLPNVRVWFSCDRDTGVPEVVPPGVRLAWLMTAADDLPPRADLIFRVRRLRRLPLARVGQALVCPSESGTPARHTDCEHCGLCWR
jgi:hypothetical protein